MPAAKLAEFSRKGPVVIHREWNKIYSSLTCTFSLQDVRIGSADIYQGNSLFGMNSSFLAFNFILT